MRALALGLAVLGCLTHPGITRPASAQLQVKGCLDPLPHQLGRALPLLGAPDEIAQADARPVLYVSPSGELCQAFQAEGTEEAPILFRASDCENRWGGIGMQGGDGTHVLRHVDIEYGEAGTAE